MLITINGDKVALGTPPQDIIELMAKWDTDLSVWPSRVVQITRAADHLLF